MNVNPKQTHIYFNGYYPTAQGSSVHVSCVYMLFGLIKTGTYKSYIFRGSGIV